MYTKDQIIQLIKEDSENGCDILLDMIETLFESNREEILELEKIWKTSSSELDFLEVEEDFFSKYDDWHDRWRETHGYKTDKT